MSIIKQFKRYFSQKNNMPLHEIPVYPPRPAEYRIEKKSVIIKRNKDAIDELFSVLDVDKKTWRKYILPVIKSLAEYMQNIPASEYDHHRHPGGLYEHSIDVAIQAIQLLDQEEYLLESICYEEGDVERTALAVNSCRIAVALAALLHDFGKLFNDFEVIDAEAVRESQNIVTRRFLCKESYKSWKPGNSSLYQWAKQENVKIVSLRWREGRHRQHEKDVYIYSEELIACVKEWLKATNLYAYNQFAMFLMDQCISGPFAKLLKKADSASVVKWSRNHPVLLTTAEAALHKTVIYLMWCKSNWRPNKPGGRLLVTSKGVFIYWKAAVEDIINELNAKEVSGLPNDPIELAKILIKTRFAVQPDNEDQGPLWRLSLVGYDKSQWFYMLMIADSVKRTARIDYAKPIEVKEVEASSFVCNSDAETVIRNKPQTDQKLGGNIQRERTRTNQLEDEVEKSLLNLITRKVAEIEPVEQDIYSIPLEDVAVVMNRQYSEVLWKMVLDELDGVEMCGEDITVSARGLK